MGHIFPVLVSYFWYFCCIFIHLPNLFSRKIRPIFPGKFHGRTGLLDLERHFAFYGAYHSNPVNIFIHTLFVWPIFFTSLVLFYFTPSLWSFPYGFCLNLGFAFTAMYAGFYVCLDQKAGSVAALLCVLCWVQSTLLASRFGFSLSWKVAAQLFCWTGQFIGHGVFECLQLVFGYEPYERFHASVEEKMEAQIKEWQDKKQKKIT